MGHDRQLEDLELDDHDRGLSHDLPTLINRRRALTIFGGAGLAAALAACGAGSTDDASGSTARTPARGAAGTLPEDACRRVYATDGYSTSVTNLAQTSLATDNVFSDGYSLQLATVTGDVTKGTTATLNVPV
jgi:hypothetical protein